MTVERYPAPVALVTGANKGIGFEIARQLGRRGFRVILTARDPRRGRDATDRLMAEGTRFQFLLMDVAERSSILATANEFARIADRLDVLVNNAAILEDEDDDILTIKADRFEQTLRTNTVGPLLVAQTFWRFLVRARGRVINLSSGAGALSDMEGGYPAYGVSKAALNAITLKLAIAGRAGGVAVNSVCPGWVRTDMGGADAERSVEEGADTVVWLATEAPDTLTGKFLRDRQEIAW